MAKVERLPPNLQVEIADRVGKYINLARTARDDDALTRFIEAAAGERERVAQAAKSTANPLWTAAARDFAARRKQDQVVHENYRKGG